MEYAISVVYNNLELDVITFVTERLGSNWIFPLFTTRKLLQTNRTYHVPDKLEVHTPQHWVFLLLRRPYRTPLCHPHSKSTFVSHCVKASSHQPEHAIAFRKTPNLLARLQISIQLDICCKLLSTSFVRCS